MSKISKTLLITLLLLALMPAIHAFESTLTIEGGVGIPLDDIEGTNKMKGAWALSWDAWMIKDWLGVGISPWFANVEVEGDDPNESYFSSLEGINLYLKLRPTKAGALNFQEQALVRRISPFVALGGGWSTHGSRDENGVGSNPSVPAGFRGHFTLPHAAAGISFLSKWNTTLDLGVKYDLFTKDNIDLTDNAGNHFENDALLTPYVGLGIHFGTPKAVPELIYDGRLDAFSTVVGTPSAAQSYKLKGKNLKGDIDLVAPEGFVLSIDGGKVWAKSVRVPADFDGDIWVRLTGEKAGTYDGSIGHQSKGTGGLFWPVNGVVREPLLPTLSLVSSGLGTFSTELGTPSAPQSYKIKAKDLTGDIVINAPAGFEFSLDGGKTYASSMRVPAGFDKDILVRLTGSNPGDFSGNISHTSPGVPTLNVPVTGTVTAPEVPSIILQTGKLNTFSTEVGTPSAAQSYKIKGNNLTGDIMIDAPKGFEISIDGGKTWKTSVNVPAGFDKDILVRLTGAQTGKYEGNISHASPGAGTFNLPVNGTVKEAVKPEEPEQGNPILDQLEQDLLKHTVHFDTNLYTIRDGDKPFLDRVAEALKKLPEIMIEIQGHTDSTGSDKINEPLSYNRAKVVKDYLVARGVDAEQIESKGYGSKVPVASNETADGKQENRRAQMVIIK
ncbi:MAG: OmpA family protein [Candidatus Cloacimonetes bacterium]|nr:OmpA family protein [Candidatus Cloacimonadota bacterium]